MIPDLCAECLAKVKAAKKAEKARRKAKATPRTDTPINVRDLAALRAGGKCECCGWPLISGAELHHVESGGLRRHRERLRSILYLCRHCHREVHNNNRSTLEAIAKSPALDSDAVAAIRRRVDKLDHHAKARQP